MTFLKQYAVALSAVLLTVSATQLQAATITFDGVTNNTATGGEVDGTEWTADGILFTTPDLHLNIGNTFAASPATPPNSLGADFSTSNDFDGQLNFQFLSGLVANDLSFTIFNTPFSATAFNIANVAIHTINSGASPSQVFDFSGFDVSRVEITGSFYAIDNVDFTLTNPASVPEPTSMALFGLTALGLGALRRRKRTAGEPVEETQLV